MPAITDVWPRARAYVQAMFKQVRSGRAGEMDEAEAGQDERIILKRAKRDIHVIFRMQFGQLPITPVFQDTVATMVSLIVDGD